MADKQRDDGDGRCMDVEQFTAMVLTFVYHSIRYPHVTPAASLASAVAARPPADGVDRISRLPDAVLKNVVSLLPAKDAARTAALASRWRALWRAVPLVLVDAQLLPDGVDDERSAPGGSHAVVAAASRALAAHPGPFRRVQLTWSHMASHRAEIQLWLRLLAAKGVQELTLINRPWPLDFPLPAALFGCVSLTRLHLGVWRFPDTSVLPRAAVFPHLQELSLTLMRMTGRDLAVLLSRSPVLEVLTIIGSLTEVRLRLISRSLRCVFLGMSGFDEIAVVDAPRLERLFVWMTIPGGEKNRISRIKIGNAPILRMLGYLQPRNHKLEIGNTIVKAGIKVSPSTTISSVQILALEVRFGVYNEVKMVPCLLKCFPNIQTLHIYSKEADEPTGKVNLKFWQEAIPIECVQFHMKKLFLQEFRGTKNELVFLKFIAERAQALEKMVITVTSEISSSADDVNGKLKSLTSAKWAGKNSKLIAYKSPAEDGGSPAWHS